MGRRHGKEDWNWNEKAHKGNFKITSRVLFPKVASGKSVYYFSL